MEIMSIFGGGGEWAALPVCILEMFIKAITGLLGGSRDGTGG